MRTYFSKRMVYIRIEKTLQGYADSIVLCMHSNWNKKPVAKLLLTWYINLADTDEPLKNKAGSEAEKLIFKKKVDFKKRICYYGIPAERNWSIQTSNIHKIVL